jgi:glyoxylase-like metal-dependent hydrolase (beta-lactamase superfamily II)
VKIMSWPLPENAARYPRIHRFDQRVPFPVNAYIVEGRQSCVAVDGLLTVSASRALRQKIGELGKPLKAVLLTHPHPDHYAGLVNVADEGTPIYAIETVAEIARGDDPVKNAIVGPMFGDEWPMQRVFPNCIARAGATLEFDQDLRFDVVDIGPAESKHDSLFVLNGEQIFVGDVIYSGMHAYLADGMLNEWRAALDKLAATLPEDAVLYPGHGVPVTVAAARWQRAYIDIFEVAVRSADWSAPERAEAEVISRMKAFLPVDDLLFLMQLSIAPTAKSFGLT